MGHACWDHTRHASWAREFAQFPNIARGSLSELEAQLLIASDLAYIKANDPIFNLTDRTSRLLTGLHKYVSGQ